MYLQTMVMKQELSAAIVFSSMTGMTGLARSTISTDYAL